MEAWIMMCGQVFLLRWWLAIHETVCTMSITSVSSSAVAVKPLLSVSICVSHL